jgi:hypothetical protein
VFENKRRKHVARLATLLDRWEAIRDEAGEWATKAEQAQRLGITLHAEGLAIASVRYKAERNVIACADAITSLTVDRSLLPLVMPLSPLEKQASQYEELFRQLEGGASAGRAAFNERFKLEI